MSEALALFPTYGAALVADAALALDADAPDARNAEDCVDPTDSGGVRRRVVFAAVDVERRRLAGGSESHNHYLVLGVTRDFGTDELRARAAFEASATKMTVHGGLRARVGGARLPRRSGRGGVRPGRHLTRAGSDGDAGHGLFQRILRRYFPEDFRYEPSAIRERKRDYEREKLAEQTRPSGAVAGSI